MDIAEMTAWERLEYTSNLATSILGNTKQGTAVSQDDEKEIHQDLIMMIGSILNFSECLADGTIHQRE